MARALVRAPRAHCVTPSSTYNAARMAVRDTRRSPKLTRVRRGARSAFHAFIFASLVAPWVSNAGAKVAEAVRKAGPKGGEPEVLSAGDAGGACPDGASPCDRGSQSGIRRVKLAQMIALG